MADNRIYLCCAECGETFFLGKTSHDGYIMESYDGIALEQKLNEFYTKHHHYEGCFDWFEIVYEDEEYRPKAATALDDTWNKVKSCPPPEGEPIIVSAHKDRMLKTFGDAILQNGQWFVHGRRLDWTVTHWMELPHPAYEREDEEDL